MTTKVLQDWSLGGFCCDWKRKFEMEVVNLGIFFTLRSTKFESKLEPPFFLSFFLLFFLSFFLPPTKISLSLSFSLSLSHCSFFHCLSLNLSHVVYVSFLLWIFIPLSMSICLSLWISLSLFFSESPFLSISNCLSISLYISLSEFLSHRLTLSFIVPLWISLSLSMFLSISDLLSSSRCCSFLLLSISHSPVSLYFCLLALCSFLVMVFFSLFHLVSMDLCMVAFSNRSCLPYYSFHFESFVFYITVWIKQYSVL